jgi:amino acid permease
MLEDSLYDPLAQNDLQVHDTNISEDTEDNSYGSERSTSQEHDEEFEMLVNAYMHDRDLITVNQAAMSISYTIINAGLIALPYTAFNAGIPLFIAIVIAMTIVSCYVAVMVINMANQMKVRTLEDLAEKCGGPNFFIWVSAFQVLFSFTMMCVTLSVWADVMSEVFSKNDIHMRPFGHLLTTRHGQVLIGGAIILPLCIFKRSMISLRWTASITVLAVAFCLAAVCISYFSHKEAPSAGILFDVYLSVCCERASVNLLSF